MIIYLIKSFEKLFSCFNAILYVDNIVHKAIHHERCSVTFEHQRFQILGQNLIVFAQLISYLLQQVLLSTRIHE